MYDMIQRMTIATRTVLLAFLNDPDVELFGHQLAIRTGISHGTVYPILARLARAGLLTHRWETQGENNWGRPPRQYYRLTPDGRELARKEQAAAERKALRAEMQALCARLATTTKETTT